jgi:hypothetical protein
MVKFEAWSQAPAIIGFSHIATIFSTPFLLTYPIAVYTIAQSLRFNEIAD